MIRSIIFFLLTLYTSYSICQTSENIIDLRDNINYKVVKIGQHTWMSENLKTKSFLNGDKIQEARTKKEWILANEQKIPVWCYYDNNPQNEEKYGILYNWYAINDSRELAPKGWHVPSDSEWTDLTDFLGGTIIAGSKLKVNDNNISISGFDALMAGNRHHRKSAGLGCRTLWWSSTGSNQTGAWLRKINCSNDYVERLEMLNWMGASLRCIKNIQNSDNYKKPNKIYLFSRNLGFEFYDVEMSLVNSYTNDFFAISQQDIESFRLNLRFLSSYLNENNRIKYISFELKSTNTTIKVFSIPKPYGDWYRVEVKSNFGEVNSKFIISDEKMSKKYTVQKINNLLAYINYHLPSKSNIQNDFKPIFYNERLK